MANETKKTTSVPRTVPSPTRKDDSRVSRETVKKDSTPDKEVGPAEPVSEEVHIGPDVDDLPDDKELAKRQKENKEKADQAQKDFEGYEKHLDKVLEARHFLPADDELTPRLLQLENAVRSVRELLRTRMESTKRA